MIRLCIHLLYSLTHSSNILLLFLLAYVCFACSGTKYLQADEQLVSSNTITLKNEEKISNKANFKYELETIAKPKENTKLFFLIPRQRLYEKAKDTSRFLRTIYQQTGQPPAIYDSTLIVESAAEMQLYLQEKGYYDAKVEPEIDTSRNGKKVYIDYQVYPKQRYRVDTTIFSSRDTNIQKYLPELAKRTLFQEGIPVSLEIYNAEVTRITKFLRNNGFSFFQRNFVSSLRADSSENRIRLQLEIFPPTRGGEHQQYRVGEIYVQPDFNPLDTVVSLRDTLIDGIHFILDETVDFIKPELLLTKITLAEGEYYQQNKEQQTINNLGALSSVKFVSMKQEIDSEQPNVLNYRILLTRNKRYDFIANLEGSYSTLSTQQANLIGTALNFSLSTRRSPLKGGALLTNGIQAGIEFNITTLDIFTVDLRLQNQINIPRFVDYFKLWRSISRGKKRPEGLYKFLEEQVVTRINGNINFLREGNLYAYLLVNGSFGYNIRFSKNRDRLLINHAGVDYFSPTIGSGFEDVIETNPFLANSFGQQLFTGFLLRDLTYFYNRKNNSNESYAVRFNTEFSGAEIGLANSLYNRFSLQSTTFRVADIDFARYALFEIDARYTKNYTPTRALAMRFNLGLVSPFGTTTEVPFVKQFFIGGPNSIRAFQARQLGPGSYCNPDVFNCEDGSVLPTDNLIPFYQTGELKLELNAEYRFSIAQIFSVEIEGATFIDVGNVWTLRNDIERPGSQFRFTRDAKGTPGTAFYEQLAIGTGFGLRTDLSYFLLRFDLGYPIRTPYNVSNPWIQDLLIRDVNFNLAIDYPF